MQIIGVKFKDRYTGEYHQKVYNYQCALEDVKIGDIVLAPTTSNMVDSEVQVCAVGVDPATILPHILPLLKTITEYAPKEEPASGN